MTDYSQYPRCIREQSRRKPETWTEVIAGAALWLVLLSLMGWSVIDWPRPEPTPTLIHPEQIRVYTAAYLAEETAKINVEMERRTRP